MYRDSFWKFYLTESKNDFLEPWAENSISLNKNIFSRKLLWSHKKKILEWSLGYGHTNEIWLKFFNMKKNSWKIDYFSKRQIGWKTYWHVNPQTLVAQKFADEVGFRRFQGEGVEFF